MVLLCKNSVRTSLQCLNCLLSFVSEIHFLKLTLRLKVFWSGLLPLRSRVWFIHTLTARYLEVYFVKVVKWGFGISAIISLMCWISRALYNGLEWYAISFAWVLRVSFHDWDVIMDNFLHRKVVTFHCKKIHHIMYE